jgi:hypothetical protein
MGPQLHCLVILHGWSVFASQVIHATCQINFFGLKTYIAVLTNTHIVEFLTVIFICNLKISAALKCLGNPSIVLKHTNYLIPLY